MVIHPYIILSKRRRRKINESTEKENGSDEKEKNKRQKQIPKKPQGYAKQVA